MFDSEPKSPKIRKTSGLWEITHGQHGATFAGSDSVCEMPELIWQIQDHIANGEEYLFIEEQLSKLGYQRHWIREAFLKETGIDPVQAYLDMDNFSIPPGMVPRYNYGWGESKTAKYDFIFILPVPYARMGVVGQKGAEREELDTFRTVLEAREELKKHVKEVRHVTPESAAMTQFMVHPLYRSANLSIVGQELLEQVNFLKDAELSEALLNDALAADRISEDDYESLRVFADEAAAPIVDPTEQEEGEEFATFREEKKSLSVNDVLEKTKLPEEDFRDRLQTRHSINIPAITQESFDVFKQMTGEIQGYQFTITSQDVDMHDVNESTADVNPLDAGSVSFIATVQENSTQQEYLILTVMMVRNGQLSYSGLFKGENDQEYGLSSPGIIEFFNDMSGEIDRSLPDVSTIQDKTHEGPMSATNPAP